MYQTPLLLGLTAALLLTGCESVIVERRSYERRPVVARTVVVEEGPYRRVYATDTRGRRYYRRAYYRNGVQTRLETRRYYESVPGPVDRTYGF